MANVKHKCPVCSKSFSIEEWDNSTIKLAANRKIRRQYVPLNKNNPEKVYKCPNPECSKVVNRTQIRPVMIIEE